MDLSVLHAVKSPDRDYRMKNKLNGITSPIGCRFLEWSGWYNQNISQRLLGHYRLFQLFKEKNKFDIQLSLPLAYIIHYRTLHVIKYALSCVTAVLYYIFTLGERYNPLFIEELNSELINSQHSILQEFLTSTDIDFEQALIEAIEQINGMPKEKSKKTLVVQNRLDYKVYNNTFHYLTEYNTTLHNNTAVGITGKEKDVFTKRQMLILLDLMADLGKMDRIDYTKKLKFQDVVILLQALNGKSKESWKKELYKYKDKGPYHYNDKAELDSLKDAITNISTTLHNAEQRELAKAADRKIRWLEVQTK